MEMLRLIPTMMDWLAAILGRHDFFARSRRVFGRGYGQRVVLKETNGCSPSEGVQDLVPSVRAPSKLMGVRFCLKAPSLGLVEREAKRKHHFFSFSGDNYFDTHTHTHPNEATCASTFHRLSRRSPGPSFHPQLRIENPPAADRRTGRLVRSST